MDVALDLYNQFACVIIMDNVHIEKVCASWVRVQYEYVFSTSTYFARAQEWAFAITSIYQTNKYSKCTLQLAPEIVLEESDDHENICCTANYWSLFLWWVESHTLHLESRITERTTKQYLNAVPHWDNFQSIFWDRVELNWSKFQRIVMIR